MSSSMTGTLTEDHLEEFKQDGITIVEGVLTDTEVETARNGFHAQLKGMNIDHDAILCGESEAASGPRIKSPVSRIFFSKWKIQVQLHPKVVSAMKDLLIQTYGNKIEGFDHPFSRFDSVLTYIDRVCWRLPDSIRAEGGLDLHIDRNPSNPYLLDSKGKTCLKKWRPIQSFVTLTDHYISNSGGLRVVKGFHKEIDKYFENEDNVEKNGEFFRMGSKKYTSLQQRLEPVFVPKGSLVCWDNRLPHATTEKFDGSDTREVVYTSLLPDISINRTYVMSQLESIRNNTPPPAYVESDPNERVDRDWELSDLNIEEKYLLGILTN